MVRIKETETSFRIPRNPPQLFEVRPGHARIRIDSVLIAGEIGQREGIFTIRILGIAKDVEGFAASIPLSLTLSDLRA